MQSVRVMIVNRVYNTPVVKGNLRSYIRNVIDVQFVDFMVNDIEDYIRSNNNSMMIRSKR